MDGNRRAVLYRGGITGAKILCSATVRREATGSTTLARRIIGAVGGTGTEVTALQNIGRNVNAGGAVRAATYGTKRTNGEVDVSGDEYSDAEDFNRDEDKLRSNGMFHYYRKCGQSFLEVERRQETLEAMYSACEVLCYS